MKCLIQRVKKASVHCEDERISEIGTGYLVFLGVEETDTEVDVEKTVEKLLKLRLFPNDEGKLDFSLKEVDGELLIVSQFTLCADTRKGRRPSFTDAASPEKARSLYHYFIERSSQSLSKPIKSGRFGATMAVSLVNDGPFTIEI
jgi:D-aminoacyl-tRNA deacylase